MKLTDTERVEWSCSRQKGFLRFVLKGTFIGAIFGACTIFVNYLRQGPSTNWDLRFELAMGWVIMGIVVQMAVWRIMERGFREPILPESVVGITSPTMKNNQEMKL